MGSRRFSGEIYGKMNVKICTLEGTGRANTEAKRNRIVQAVNSFDHLLVALKQLLNKSEKHIFGDECLRERDQARAAIKLAEGK
jgi:hypothetical protein